MHKVLIISCGGTFSKVYDPIKGELYIPKNLDILRDLLNRFFKNNIDFIKLQEYIYKDSLDMTQQDREGLKRLISNSSYHKFIVIHGTDTMDLSAKEIETLAITQNKEVVFVGAMEPISFNPIEGSINLGVAYGFLQSNNKSGIFLSMNGIISSVDKIVKNKQLGYFQWQK